MIDELWFNNKNNLVCSFSNGQSTTKSLSEDKNYIKRVFVEQTDVKIIYFILEKEVITCRKQ